MGSTTVEDQRTSVEATHKVALTNNYYIGVFEVTQSQWSLIATNSPSSANFTTEKAMRPRELVCYNEIRLKANSTVAATDSEIRTYSWPKNPHPSSFLGLLNLKSGLDFDLPSEAQWEFAARAGNGVGYWGNGSAIMNADTDANLNLLGRYERNGGKISSGTSYVNPSSDCGVTNGTAIVGSYAPNAWGLYDMHGNVWEWCLDWYAADISGIGGKVNIDPDAPANTLSGGPVSGGNRVKRSGSWADVAGLCRPANHTADEPQRRGWSNGLRVVCTAGLQ